MEKNDITNLIETLCEVTPDGTAEASTGLQALRREAARALLDVSAADEDGDRLTALLATLLSGSGTEAARQAFVNHATGSAAVRLEAESALAFVEAVEQSTEVAPAHLMEELASAVASPVGRATLWSRIADGFWPTQRWRVVAACVVVLVASTAFGLIAYNMNVKAPVAEVAAKGPAAPATVGYFVAARPLPRGTLARDEDFAVRSVPPEGAPAGAILETPDSKAGLPGSLVRKFVDAGKPVTLDDILRPRDRGFLAGVLAPDSRAITIKVDEKSGVAGLIRPGDRVDVVLTQVFDKADPARRALSETVLGNVRVIAIDQEIAQGGPPVSATISKAQAQTVSLELTPEQVKKITVAKQLGKLSLAVRAAVDQWNKAADSGAVSSCDVSPEIARQNALAGQHTEVVVHSGGEVKQYSVRKQGDDGDVDLSCDGSSAAARESATAVAAKVLEKH